LKQGKWYADSSLWGVTLPGIRGPVQPGPIKKLAGIKEPMGRGGSGKTVVARFGSAIPGYGVNTPYTLATWLINLAVACAQTTHFFLYFEVQKYKKPSAGVSSSLAEATNSGDPDALSHNEGQLSHD
jgi:hypothetical protein